MRRIRKAASRLPPDESQVFGEGERRQHELGEPPRSGFGAARLQRSRGRPRGNEAAVAVRIDQRLQMRCPVAQILDLVEKDVQHGAGRPHEQPAEPLQEVVQGESGEERRFEG
jgi:hypothetical protein